MRKLGFWYDVYDERMPIAQRIDFYHDASQLARSHSEQCPADEITVYKVDSTGGRSKCIRFIGGIPILGGGGYITQRPSDAYIPEANYD